MIPALLLLVAAIVLPTILVLGMLFLLGSAVAAIADGATAGLVRPAAMDARPEPA